MVTERSARPARRRQQEDDAGPKRAVLYLRVSSAAQVKTDYDPEGISIPAQRAACLRKAEQIRAVVTDEYMEARSFGHLDGEAGCFQQMLGRIKTERDVDGVIIYKLSRLNRNWVENAIVVDRLQRQGVALVSATEQIDETPQGQMMLGMLAAFNGYRSAEDAEDIRYKMGEKARRGGTLGPAALGYLNARDRSEGRNIGIVVRDPERAEFIPLAYSLFVTDRHTLDELENELYDRGLRSRNGRKVTASRLQRVLRNRYYLGYVAYQGEEFAGRHEPLITPELFERVQDILDARSGAGVRKLRYHHYLKGSLLCGECHDNGRESRMILNGAIGRRGGEYFYFFCRARQEHLCGSRYLDIDQVEDTVLRHYAEIQLSAEFIEFVGDSLTDALSDQESANELLRRQLRIELERIDEQEERLLDLAADGELASTKVKARLADLKAKRFRVQETLDRANNEALVQGARSYSPRSSSSNIPRCSTVVSGLNNDGC